MVPFTVVLLVLVVGRAPRCPPGRGVSPRRGARRCPCHPSLHRRPRHTFISASVVSLSQVGRTTQRPTPAVNRIYAVVGLSYALVLGRVLPAAGGGTHLGRRLGRRSGASRGRSSPRSSVARRRSSDDASRSRRARRSWRRRWSRPRTTTSYRVVLGGVPCAGARRRRRWAPSRSRAVSPGAELVGGCDRPPGQRRGECSGAPRPLQSSCSPRR